MSEKTERIGKRQKVAKAAKRLRASHRAPSYEKRLERRRLARVEKKEQSS